MEVHALSKKWTLKAMGSHRSRRCGCPSEVFQRPWTLTVGDMGRKTILVRIGGNSKFSVVFLKVLWTHPNPKWSLCPGQHWLLLLWSALECRLALCYRAYLCTKSQSSDHLFAWPINRNEFVVAIFPSSPFLQNFGLKKLLGLCLMASPGWISRLSLFHLVHWRWWWYSSLPEK